ncbi:ras-like protein [Anaeramoeba flamelloides]|uniref:Ras-like protein n=1 Tax=Anaeramoeba flamelloides TaxID=1746091 RepID=A0ABQ8XJY1_9EUKA|nr:ras-like protein [Anaeramoeba flamelloides]
MTEDKLVVLGQASVGKSTLINQFVHSIFIDVYDPTLEDAYLKEVKIDDEWHLLDILDTFEYEDYTPLKDSWLREGEAFLIVYSITSRRSFDKVATIREEVKMMQEYSDYVSIILVGNKCDLENERQISREEGQDLAKTFNCPFFETSAKDRINVDESFFSLAREKKFQNEKRLEKKESIKSEKSLKKKQKNGYKVKGERVHGGGTFDIYYEKKLVFSRVQKRRYPGETELLELIEKEKKVTIELKKEKEKEKEEEK